MRYKIGICSVVPPSPVVIWIEHWVASSWNYCSWKSVTFISYCSTPVTHVLFLLPRLTDRALGKPCQLGKEVVGYS